jgi:muscarinic acetylcholine receptor M3
MRNFLNCYAPQKRNLLLMCVSSTLELDQNNKCFYFFSAAAWIISLGLWPPWIYLWPIIEGRRTVPETQCYIQFILTNQYITFGTAIAAFYVPVTVMCFLYFRIYRETKKRQKDLPNLQAMNKPHK